MRLLWRVFLVNGVLVCAAWAGLAFSPARIDPPTVVSGLIGVSGLAILLVANFFLLRRVLDPLGRLTRMAREFEPLRPGPRIPVYASDREIVELTDAFNEMLDRLARERIVSAQRALEAQEGERARIARELHDEIGQSLTAVLLQIEHAYRHAPAELQPALGRARETARETLEEAKRLAGRLRPEALDDLGLRVALLNLSDRIARSSNVHISRRIPRELPELSPEAELVIYRVAQEALTNVIRHSQASEAELELIPDGDSVLLRVADNGVGIAGDEGGGLTGMRERALLIGADLRIGPLNGRGTEVRLRTRGGR
jgi:two-component system sensor histidine kinase UhpB